MKKIGLFYGSDSDNTDKIVQKVKKYFQDNLDLIYISDSNIEQMKSYENIILASPTWGDGALQFDWDDFEDNLDEIDFSNKKIALIGLGDQESYADTFCDAAGILYEKVKDGKVIGKTSPEGYYFEESRALVDNEFIGLIIDEMNQDELTEVRVENWVKQIQEEFEA